MLVRTDYVETQKQLTVASDGHGWITHIRSALARGLPEFTPTVLPHDGTMIICGSGPSLPQSIEAIRTQQAARRPICAVKGTHDFLVAQGIEPTLFVSVEPRDRCDQVRLHTAKTLYYLASRVHPAVFDQLADRNVVLFHTYGNDHEVPELAGKILVGGGTTSGLRAVTLGYLMGFAKFVLYGFDSCLADDGKTKRFTGEQAGTVIDRWVNGRRFLCNGAMAMQADEFQNYYSLFPDIAFDVPGNGLIAAILAERTRLGKRT